MRRFLFTVGALLGCLISVQGQQNDDSSRGVARISVLAGDVSVRRGDSGDQITATLNAPLVLQDRLMTGQGARAELQFDFANMMRLGANTEIRLAELQSNRFQVNLAVGLITFRVWQNSQAEVDINTPMASIRPLRKGEYRIQVLEDGTTEVTVRDGGVDIFTPQGSRQLGQGRTLTLRKRGSGEAEFEPSSEIPVDSWDRWNRSRDQELANSRSSRYLPQGVYGGEQLDAHGDWVYSAPYGNVWQPRVAAGWAPYRVGRWSWLDWYGWSWVSYDPWGWAPYHYGRWFNNAGNWCWWPGAGGSQHFWSPALVSFVGFGNRGLGAGFGFGWGNVGWVPLAPFETYNRWWGRGYYGNHNNFNNTTIVNNVNITNIYRNARVDGGVSYVEAQNFNRGISHSGGDGNGYRAANRSELGNASEFRGPVGIAPNRESVGFARQEGVRGSSSNFASREDQSFTARRQPSSVERVPFEEQRQNVERIGRGSGMIRAEEGVRGTGSPARSEGWQRVGERSVDSSLQRDTQRENGARSSQRGSEGFVQRDSGVRGGGSGSSDGYRRIGGDSNVSNGTDRSAGRVSGARGSEGVVTRESDSNSRSGWQRFGDSGVNNGVRGGGRSSEGFVQRESGVSSGSRGGGMNSSEGSSRSRGVGEVDVRPRIVERNDSFGNGSGRTDGSGRNDGSGNSGGTVRGNDLGGQRIERQNQGSGDPFGGGTRGGGSNSGWGSFGGARGGGSEPGYSAPRMQESAPRNMPDSGRGGFGGYGGGGGYSPQMSAPSGNGGVRGGGGGSAPSGGAGGGAGRGGGASSSGSAPGGGGRGGRGGNQ